ncbi:MAG: hypothetical protein ACRDG3_05180 [Tepidiformaceae bacterium]
MRLATSSFSFGRRSAGLALLIGFAALAAMLSMGLGRASASVWCAGDPTILVDGNPVSVTVSVPFNELSSIQDVTVTYHVASNAHVLLALNTGILFREKIVIVKDQPAEHGLLSVSKIPVDIVTHYRGAAFPMGVTQIALGGTHLWISGSSDQVMHATAYGLLSLHLF